MYGADVLVVEGVKVGVGLDATVGGVYLGTLSRYGDNTNVKPTTNARTVNANCLPVELIGFTLLHAMP